MNIYTYEERQSLYDLIKYLNDLGKDFKIKEKYFEEHIFTTEKFLEKLDKDISMYDIKGFIESLEILETNGILYLIVKLESGFEKTYEIKNYIIKKPEIIIPTKNDEDDEDGDLPF